MTETPLRTKLRNSALRVIRTAGGLRVTGRSRWRARRLLILCYHGFSQADEHLWDPQLFVTGAHLEARLRFLREAGYTVLPLKEGLARLAGGRLPPRAVAITVDDGLADFYTVAYPTFARYGIPVTVFVSTYYVFDSRPVFDVACSYLLWKASVNGPTVVEDPEHGRPLALKTPADAAALVTRIREVSRQAHWTADRKHEWLGFLARQLQLDWEGWLSQRLLGLMRPEELRKLEPGIADIQLHTHRHRVPEDRDLFLREIRDNRQALADCGVDPAGLTQFCYPSGVYRSAFLPWLVEAGVTHAVTGIPGLASPQDHPLLLPRFIDGTETSEVEFEAWASGFRQFVHRRAR